MDERIRAEEHLRVIRSLMERVTVYRAISAPTALIGGLTSLAVAGWMLWRSGVLRATENGLIMNSRDFILPWFLPLLLTASANTFFLWREARRDRRPFLSPGLRLALRSLLPAFFVGAACTFAAWFSSGDRDAQFALALTWISCYGLALLATMSFAPRSLCLLGWSFVLTAVLWLLVVSATVPPPILSPILHGPDAPHLAMGLTFGVYHLVYAIATWSSGRGTTFSRPE